MTSFSNTSPDYYISDTLETDIEYNIELIKKYANDKNIEFQRFSLGDKANTICVVFYIKDVTSMKIIDELVNKLKLLNSNKIINTDSIVKHFEKKKTNPFSQLIQVQKLESIMNFLIEGKCIILTSNSASGVATPCTMVDWLTHENNTSSASIFSNILKVLNILLIFIALFLPAIYVATVTYHLDIIGIKTAMSLVSSRKDILIPFIVEVFTTMLIFDILKFDSKKINKNSGRIITFAIGIILCIIAVVANIISPITASVIAISELTFISLPSIYNSYRMYMVRYIFIFLAFLNGYLALSLGTLILLLSIADSNFLKTDLLQSFWKDKEVNMFTKLFSNHIYEDSKHDEIQRNIKNVEGDNHG